MADMTPRKPRLCLLHIMSKNQKNPELKPAYCKRPTPKDIHIGIPVGGDLEACKKCGVCCTLPCATLRVDASEIKAISGRLERMKHILSEMGIDVDKVKTKMQSNNEVPRKHLVIDREKREMLTKLKRYEFLNECAFLVSEDVLKRHRKTKKG